MSGGVDSSTVAAMLFKEGYDVVGVTMQLYDQAISLMKKGACCAGQDIYDAKEVADKFGFPHYILNYESVFKEEVIKDFADSYVRGETPIPCVRCNQSVKFRDMLKFAKDLNADALVTGHYVQKKEIDGNNYLAKGADPRKDQSYFLFSTTKDQLEYLYFPLGGLKKEETRKLATEFGLEIADKPDSQDICFVPDGDYAKIVRKERPEAFKAGDIIHISTGVKLGEHDGIINYTIGQRKGLGISSKDPLYVIKIDPRSNSVFVGEAELMGKTEFYINELNWIGDEAMPDDGIEVSVKLRSMHKPVSANIYQTELPDKYRIKLQDPERAVTPGQACVMYDQDIVLGGGWILAN